MGLEYDGVLGEFCEFVSKIVKFRVVEIFFSSGVAARAVFGEKMLARVFDSLL